MPVYSHSQLRTFEECPLKYKLQHVDGIRRDTEGIEAFLGNMVHEALRKCYDGVRLCNVCTSDELADCFDRLWQKNWHDDIVISKKDVTVDCYRNLGRRMIESYYKRHAPFDGDITLGTEMRIKFSLDDGGRYQLQGVIDRLSRTRDGVHHINDYKTGAHLPTQAEADDDRQLALYQIAVHKRWPHIKDVTLVWHYLACDCELVSTRRPERLADLANETMRLIDEIELAHDFPPRESGLCGWCEYPDLCPNRKHFYVIEDLPASEYLKEPGVVLVNKYAELKEKAREIDEATAEVRDALIQYAEREEICVIKGSGCKARVKIENKLKFPGKNDPGRVELDGAVAKAGKWEEVSQLDVNALTRLVEGGLWDKALVSEVMKYSRFEKTSTVFLSKVRDGEEE